MSDIKKYVGKQIKKYRNMKNLTQEQLAFKAGLHRAYIGQIERGEKNIGLINLEKISKVLDIHIIELLRDY